MEFTDNFISYWKLEESSGIRYDARENHNLTDDGTTSNSLGVINNAAKFSPITEDNQLSAADHTDFDIGTSEFAFSFWVWIDSTTTSNIAIRKGTFSSANRSYMLYGLGGTEMRWRVSTTGSNDIDVISYNSSLTLTTGVWHHVVITRHGNVTSLYIDGVSVASAADSRNYFNSNQDITFGGNDNFDVFNGANTSRLDGYMDELGFWRRGLSSSEVSTLYNSGQGISYESLIKWSYIAKQVVSYSDTAKATSIFSSPTKHSSADSYVAKSE